MKLEPCCTQIADRGMRALAKLLDSKSVISILELQDNQVCDVNRFNEMFCAHYAVSPMKC